MEVEWSRWRISLFYLRVFLFCLAVGVADCDKRLYVRVCVTISEVWQKPEQKWQHAYNNVTVCMSAERRPSGQTHFVGRILSASVMVLLVRFFVSNFLVRLTMQRLCICNALCGQPGYKQLLYNNLRTRNNFGVKITGEVILQQPNRKKKINTIAAVTVKILHQQNQQLCRRRAILLALIGLLYLNPGSPRRPSRLLASNIIALKKRA